MVLQDTNTTLIHQLYQELYRRIKQGIYPDGSKLPGSNKLAKEFEVSRSTVDAAIDLLVRKRYLERRSRSGTYVLNRKLRILYVWHCAQKEFDPTHFNEDMAINQLLLHGLYVESQNFGMEITSEYIPLQTISAEKSEKFFSRAAREFDGAVIRGFDNDIGTIFYKYNMPYAIWRGETHTPCPGGSIVTDDRHQAFEEIVSCLKRKNYRRVIILFKEQHLTDSFLSKLIKKKISDFCRIAEAEGITQLEKIKLAENFDWNLFHTLTPADVVFCTQTDMVSKIYVYCQKNGLAIGKNFGLFGYASGMTFTNLFPETAYGQIDFREICRQLCQSLQNMIFEEKYSEISVPSRFIEGGSL